MNAWVKRFLAEGIDGLETRPGRGRKPIMDCSDEQTVHLAIEQGRQSVSKTKEVWQQATGKRARDITFKGKSPRRSCISTSMRNCKNLKHSKEKVVLICIMPMKATFAPKGMFPTVGSFPVRMYNIASGHSARMNILGMINRKNNYKGSATTDSITADKVVEFLDTFSFQVRKNTFVVLDNTTVHRNHKVKELRPIWEKRGLSFFYLPPYSPHLNIAETLWKILKGKWIRPKDYASTETLFYASNRILTAVGKSLFIKYSHTVA